jgi:hypothetical protein
MYIADIALIMLLVCLIKEKTKALKNADFLLACASLVICFILAFVLIAAPKNGVGSRIYYSACFFAIIGFIFILKFADIYNLKLHKYAVFLSLLAVLAWLPAMLVSAVNLYEQDYKRTKTIKTALKEGRGEVYLPYLLPIDGPTENLDVLFLDFLYFPPEDRNKIYNIKIRPYSLIQWQKYLARWENDAKQN